jgi:hypothetical protein
MPIVASVSDAIASTVLCVHTTESTSPTAPANAGNAICQRRSRCRSALRATSTIATTAAANGIADNSPIMNASVTPVALMIVGNPKLTPYKPITNEKYVRLPVNFFAVP